MNEIDICQLKMFAEIWKRDIAFAKADYPTANLCFYESERYKECLIKMIDMLPDPTIKESLQVVTSEKPTSHEDAVMERKARVAKEDEGLPFHQQRIGSKSFEDDLPQTRK